MPDRSKAPDIRPFGRLTLPDEKVGTLSNGVTLHTLAGGDQDVVRIDIAAEGGPSDTANPCTATLAAELLTEGCRGMSGEAIADKTDYNGALLNSNASGHFTKLQLASLTSKLEEMAPTAVACMLEPSFPEDTFALIKQKGIARQKLNMSRVSFLASADNKQLICGARHPDGRIVTPEEIEAITREDIIKFHSRTLNGRHIHAYLAGKFDSRAESFVAKLLEQLPESDEPSPMRVVKFAPEAPTLRRVEKPGALQNAVAMSLPAPGRHHDDYNALRMAVTALGGYFGSRLMMNVREDKGYTYGISASLLGSHEGGYITISAQCDRRYTDALIEEVRHELRRMADEPLSDDEMERLRFNSATDLASTLDSPFTIMDYYELQRLVGIPADYFDARQATTKSISKEEICRLSAQYLQPEQLRISIAGEFGQ